jgi:hypothetical protein
VKARHGTSKPRLFKDFAGCRTIGCSVRKQDFCGKRVALDGLVRRASARNYGRLYGRSSSTVPEGRF